MPAGSAGQDMKLLVLSAETEDGLERATRNLGEFLRDRPETSLADAAYTLHTGRKAVPVPPRAGLLRCPGKRSHVWTIPRTAKYIRGESELDRARVIFLFPGKARSM